MNAYTSTFALAALTPPRYIVMTASARVGSSFGEYRRVGVVEVAPDFPGTPKMLSERAIGVARIVQTWERLNVGKTNRCAYAVALAAATALAAQLNA